MGHSIYVLKVFSGSNIALCSVALLEIVKMSLWINRGVLSRVLNIVGCKKVSAQYLGYRDLASGKPGFVWIPR